MIKFMCYLGAVILMVCGLIILLSSCTKEIIAGADKWPETHTASVSGKHDTIYPHHEETTGWQQTVIDGAWTATVIVGNEWIMLDKRMIDDPWIWTDNPRHYKNYPGFDNEHWINSMLTAADGNSSISDPETDFRIGLKTPLPNYLTVPARYV
jgi:hypothetical protein